MRIDRVPRMMASFMRSCLQTFCRREYRSLTFELWKQHPRSDLRLDHEVRPSSVAIFTTRTSECMNMEIASAFWGTVQTSRVSYNDHMDVTSSWCELLLRCIHYLFTRWHVKSAFAARQVAADWHLPCHYTVVWPSLHKRLVKLITCWILGQSSIST